MSRAPPLPPADRPPVIANLHVMDATINPQGSHAIFQNYEIRVHWDKSLSDCDSLDFYSYRVQIHPSRYLSRVYVHNRMSKKATYVNKQLIDGPWLIKHEDEISVDDPSRVSFKLHMPLLENTPVLSVLQIRETNTFQDQYCVSLTTMGLTLNSQIFLASDSKRNRQLICKLTRIDKPSANQYYPYEKEPINMGLLHHHNILPLMAAFKSKHNMYMFSPLARGGDLKSYYDIIRSSSPFLETEIRWIARQILQGLDHMHGRGICHRDLKPRNILCATGPNIKWLRITDFGASIHLIPGMRDYSRKGTKEYRAPEMFMTNRGHNSKADIYSVGMVILLLLTGLSRLPDPYELLWVHMFLNSPDNIDLYLRAVWSRYVVHKYPGISPSAQLFIQACLQFDDNARPAAKDALNHPWLLETREQLDKLDQENIDSWDDPPSQSPFIKDIKEISQQDSNLQLG